MEARAKELSVAASRYSRAGISQILQEVRVSFAVSGRIASIVQRAAL